MHSPLTFTLPQEQSFGCLHLQFPYCDFLKQGLFFILAKINELFIGVCTVIITKMFLYYNQIHVLLLYISTFMVFQGLVWACVSIVLSSAISKKISPHIVGFVLENVIKSLGSDCFPSHVYERFVQNFHNCDGFVRLKLTHFDHWMPTFGPENTEHSIPLGHLCKWPVTF